MKPSDNNRKPLENSDLVKIPRRTLGKNMRSLEDIMADYIAGVKLTGEEEGLLDLKVKEKTGKHIDKFKDKQKDAQPILSVESGSATKQEAREKDKKKNAPKLSESVS